MKLQKYLPALALLCAFTSSGAFAAEKNVNFTDVITPFNITILRGTLQGDISIRKDEKSIKCGVSPIASDPMSPIDDKFDIMEKNYLNASRCIIGMSSLPLIQKEQNVVTNTFGMPLQEAQKQISTSLKSILKHNGDQKLNDVLKVVQYSLMSYQFSSDNEFSRWKSEFIEKQTSSTKELIKQVDPVISGNLSLGNSINVVDYMTKIKNSFDYQNIIDDSLKMN